MPGVNSQQVDKATGQEKNKTRTSPTWSIFNSLMQQAKALILPPPWQGYYRSVHWDSGDGRLAHSLCGQWDLCLLICPPIMRAPLQAHIELGASHQVLKTPRALRFPTYSPLSHCICYSLQRDYFLPDFSTLRLAVVWLQVLLDPGRVRFFSFWMDSSQALKYPMIIERTFILKTNQQQELGKKLGEEKESKARALKGRIRLFLSFLVHCESQHSWHLFTYPSNTSSLENSWSQQAWMDTHTCGSLTR